MGNILEIKNLVLNFDTEEGKVEALDGINLNIKEGVFHGLIGETGCGKSVTGLTIMKLLDNNANIDDGQILYKGQDLLQLNEKKYQRNIRGNEIAMIFQDPSSSLNPVFNIYDQIEEAIKIYKKSSKEEYKKMVFKKLNDVKLPDVETLIYKYPHQLSGGMKQRIMIAMMLSCNPSLLIADEPTTALDVSIQAQFLNVLKELKEEFKMSVLYITHNLAVVSELCDMLSVMYAGRIVETGTVEEIFKDPKHPYTIKLMNSVLGVDSTIDSLEEIPGSVPRLINPPKGCRFHPRCDEAIEECSKITPVYEEKSKEHYVACHRR